MTAVRRLAFALISAGAALRLLWIARPSLWSDEASTLLIARLPLGELLQRLPRLEATPPLHFVLMHLWLAVLPPGPLALRLFSWLCGAASLWLFWKLAEELSPARAAWALAAAVLCSSWVHAAQDGRCYALVLALSLACALLAWRLARDPSPRGAGGYALLGACGVLTHHFFCFSVAADLLFLAAPARRRKAVFAVAFLGPATAALLVAGQALAQGGAMRGASMIVEGMTPRHAAEILGQLLADPWYFGLAETSALRALGAAALAAALLAAPSFFRRAPAAAAFCWLHLALPFLLIPAAEAAVGTPLSQARYLLPASPFLLLLLIDACAALPARWARAAAATALTAALAAGLAGYLYCAARVDPHLADLAAALRKATPAETPVVHLNPFYYLPLRFYYLPERKHYYLKRGDKTFLIPALPGYDGLITPDQLPALGRDCAVVDPGGLLFPRKLGLAPCAQLSPR